MALPSRRRGSVYYWWRGQALPITITIILLRYVGGLSLFV